MKASPTKAVLLAEAGGRLVSDYGAFQVYELPVLAPFLAADPEIEPLTSTAMLRLNSGELDTSTLPASPRRYAAAPHGKRLHIVQFDAPIRGEWLDQATALGLKPIAYVPENAYLMLGQSEAIPQLQLHAAALHVQWEGQFEPAWKIHADAVRKTSPEGGEPPGVPIYAVQMVNDPDLNPATFAIIGTFANPPIRSPQSVLVYQNIVLPLTAAERDLLAAQPDVVSIAPYISPRRFGERQSQIVAGNVTGIKPAGPGYLDWLAAKGFAQAQFVLSDFVVDVSDSGIDNGTVFADHFGLHNFGQLGGPSRISYSLLIGTPNYKSTLAGCDGHGTLNAHIIAGYSDQSGFPFADPVGFRYGLGVCPFVKVGASVIFDPEAYTNPRLTDLQSQAYFRRARISNNSWGGAATSRYDLDAQEMDALVRDAQPPSATFPQPGNQEMVIVVAAGNDGPNLGTLTSPGTAKNVISVGASENVQMIGGLDGSYVGDSQANSASDMLAFSARGPCEDGRIKPDLVAPGTHVSGGVPQANPAGALGTADACFTADGVSGGSGGALFFPSGQQFYTVSSGTSHAAPAVAGAAALLRQYFLNQGLAAPSPAMTKAWLMNSSTYLTGVGGNDSLPSNTQGMGRINLGTAFDEVPRIFRDQLSQDMLTATGQSKTFEVTPADLAKPFLVTLAWTDAPGSTFGEARNNNLDLTVTAADVTYKGNVFAGRWSTPGGTSDPRNNVESVYLPEGFTGAVRVIITAANIVADGVPNNRWSRDQDYALVIYNATLNLRPQIEAAGTVLLSEAAPANGSLDPGETVTMAFGLRNVGAAATTNLIATLLPSPSISSVSEAQHFGKLAAGGGNVQKAFSFRAAGICGSIITATLQLQDGPRELSGVTFNLRLGKAVTNALLQQSFDSGTLPPGWSTSHSQAGVPWVTRDLGNDGAAFASEADLPGVTELLSPSILVTSSASTLSFTTSFNIEAHDVDISKSYDGAVMEASVGNGPWRDIIESGAYFINGGYTHTIDPESDNPLAGRSSWAGLSAGYQPVNIQLPVSWEGQTARLRWRLGTDTGNFYGGTGWYVDNVLLTEIAYSCVSFPAPPSLLSIRREQQHLLLAFDTVRGQSYTLERAGALSGTSWTPAGDAVIGTGLVLTLTNNLPETSVFFRVRSP